MFAKVVCGNALQIPLPDESVQCVVTSPPYWGLRDYGVAEQIGLEPTPEEYVDNMVEVFREVWRVLRSDGTLWLNLGDSYAGSANGSGGSDEKSSKQTTNRVSYFSKSKRIPRGSGRWGGGNNSAPGLKPKDMVGIPWRVAFALQADGWYLRSDIIWHKPNPMPESVTDRPTSAHEYLFLMSKSERYYYDNEAIKEPCKSGPSDIKKMIEKKDRIGGNKHKALIDPLAKASSATNIGRKRGVGSPTGRNKRSVWTIATRSYPGAHFATFPPALVEPCILAGTSAEGQCSVCGAPMQRIVDKEFVPQEDVSLEHGVRGNGGQKPMDASNSWGNVPRGSNKTTTVAWAHGCNCDSDTVPQLVMDPFAGTGTVGQVAIKHGRSFVGVELSMDYIGLAQKRLHCLPVAMF